MFLQMYNQVLFKWFNRLYNTVYANTLELRISYTKPPI